MPAQRRQSWQFVRCCQKSRHYEQSWYFILPENCRPFPRKLNGEFLHVRRYRRNRDLLLAGLPEAGFDRFAPAGGAFYIYCDVAHLTNDSRDFCKRMQATMATFAGFPEALRR